MAEADAFRTGAPEAPPSQVLICGKGRIACSALAFAVHSLAALSATVRRSGAQATVDASLVVDDPCRVAVVAGNGGI